MKIHFRPLCFYETYTLVPVYTSQNRIQRGFSLLQKKKKKKWRQNSTQRLFCSKSLSRQHTAWAARGASPSSIPPELHSASQYQTTIALNCVCEHLCFISVYTVHIHRQDVVVQLLLCLILCEYARLPCPSLSRGVCSNSCPLSRWYHRTISSSVAPFSSWPQSFPASGSFPMNQLFAWGGQSTGALASASRCILRQLFFHPTPFWLTKVFIGMLYFPIAWETVFTVTNKGGGHLA